MTDLINRRFAGKFGFRLARCGFGLALCFGISIPAEAAEVYALTNINGSEVSLMRYDQETGDQIAGVPLKTPGGNAYSFDRISDFEFGPDGMLYALTNLTGNDAVLMRYDLATGDQIAGVPLKTPGGNAYSFDRISDFEFGPNGMLYALTNLTGNDAVLMRYDLATGDQIAGVPLKTPGGNAYSFDRISDFEFGPNGMLYALTNLTGNDAVLMRYDLATGDQIAGVPLKTPGGNAYSFDRISDFEFGPDGMLYALTNLTGNDAVLMRYDLATGDQIAGVPLKTPGGNAYSFDRISDFQFAPATHTAAVPEPASWSMMIAGVLLCGAAMRGRKWPICRDSLRSMYGSTGK